MNEVLDIRTLGGLTIQRDDKVITDLGSRKAEALLVYLACTQRSQPREVLADFFWEGLSQQKALTNLRVALTSLRKYLGPFLNIARDSVTLNPDTTIQFEPPRDRSLRPEER